MDFISISNLKKEIGKNKLKFFEATICCQIENILKKETKNGDPYFEILIVDDANSITLRVWFRDKIFKKAEKLEENEFISINGKWSNGNFGIEVKEWTYKSLNDEEINALLLGSKDAQDKLNKQYDEIVEMIEGFKDLRLKDLSLLFLNKFCEKFKRTGAARDYHHARVGGLVDHVNMMMRSAKALSQVYEEINEDLLLTGAFFHDSGKLWENCYQEKSFKMPYTEVSELLGHINLGIELVNSLWKENIKINEDKYKNLEPASENLRIHLLHLIASHHGEMEWGSPVLPKTPEAQLLHYIDNIDAKMEMFKTAYREGKEITSTIIDRRRPLKQRFVKPLKPNNSLELEQNK